MLTATNLRSDPMLIRKIKRMQQTEAEEAEESSDEEMLSSGNVVHQNLRTDSLPRSSSRTHIGSTQHSIVEDVGDPSDNDEDESM